MTSPSNNFQYVAPFYDMLAKLVFLGRIKQSQLTHLSWIPNNSKVLFIGGGSNSSLKQILKLKPESQICYVDTSSKMIKRAQSKLSPANINQVQFICGDQDSIPDERYDVVICFFFLDLFQKKKLRKILLLLDRKTKANGLWLVADFLPPQECWQFLLSKLMFAFFRLLSNIENKQMLDLLKEIEFNDYRKLELKKYYRNFIFGAAYQKPAYME